MKVLGVGQSYNAKNNYGKRNVNFKAADVNILAQADQHGNIMTMPQVEQTIKSRKDKIFKNPEARSTMNILAIPGDFIMNPYKGGYRTHPDKINGDFQVEYLKELIDITNETAGKNSNFEALYTPGNHDYDGGDEWLMEHLADLPMTTIMTNVNLVHSPLVKKYMKEHRNIVKSKIITVQDDKNPDLRHKVLFVGATIPTMDFYAPGLLKGTEFYGNSNKKDANIKKEDMESTIASIKLVVDNFKKAHPKGAVVLMSHTGNTISEMIREEIPKIDIILNGHDHEDTSVINGTIEPLKVWYDKINGPKAPVLLSEDTKIELTSSLGMDNEILKSFNLHFDDNGNLDKKIITQTYNTRATNMENISSNRMHHKIQEDFKKDLEPLVVNLDPEGDLTEFKYGKFIRYQNSHLMNYLTSAIHGVVKNEFGGMYKDIDAVAVQTSGVRGGIKEGSNNLELMKIFDGVSENLSETYIGKVSGRDLVGMIVENVRDNLKKPDRNTLLYWSNIQINRKLIEEILNGTSKAEFSEAIKLRNPKTRKFGLPLDINKEYKLLLPNKYLVKTDIEYPNKIRKNFVGFGKTSDELLRMALEHDKYKEMASEKVKETRIIYDSNA